MSPLRIAAAFIQMRTCVDACSPICFTILILLFDHFASTVLLSIDTVGYSFRALPLNYIHIMYMIRFLLLKQ